MTDRPVFDEIMARLSKAFEPVRLDLVDVSAAHAGHAGARQGGESHFELTIQSSHFDGLSRLAAHRLIHQELSDLLAGPVHALQINLAK